GAQRYSSGCRSNASASASVPSSAAASSYSARACPISFWAIDEKATSSSSVGAMPVHSESRQPTISSSSANPSSRSVLDESAGALTCLLQPSLDRVAVDAAVLEVELVGPVGDLVDRRARYEPEALALAAAAELLARPGIGEGRIGRLDRPRVRERLSLPLLAEDLVDHAASRWFRTVSRTHFSWSRKRRRNASRSCERGPWPVTTAFSSSQSGSVYSQTPSSRRCSFASGTVSPSSRICGT